MFACVRVNIVQYILVEPIDPDWLHCSVSLWYERSFRQFYLHQARFRWSFNVYYVANAGFHCGSPSSASSSFR